MNYRTLGRTGLRVSEIGFGAWGIGGGLWHGSDDAESLRALCRAVGMGVNFIDTALAYGSGHSERLVGRLLRERSGSVYVATKIPPKNGEWPARAGSRVGDVFPAEYILKCTDRSLRNLGVDVIDLQQLHVWRDEWTEEEEWYGAIRTLKDQGKIRFFGVSINDHEPENALRLCASGKVDVVQVIYNIFDQSPAEKLFPWCQEHRIGVIVRVPFDEGGLTGAITLDTRFHSSDFRSRYFRGDRKAQVVERVNRLRTLLDGEAHTLPELALRFCLSHPAVSTVIPGMRSVRHVEANCSVADGRLLSAEMLGRLAEHRWDRNFYE